MKHLLKLYQGCCPGSLNKKVDIILHCIQNEISHKRGDFFFGTDNLRVWLIKKILTNKHPSTQQMWNNVVDHTGFRFMKTDVLCSIGEEIEHSC